MKLVYSLKAPILVDSAESEIMRALRMQGRISRDQAALDISRVSGKMIGDVLQWWLPLATTHLSIKLSRVSSKAGIIGAISLALDYLFVVENNPHFASKSKEVMSTYH
jgi:hypothetical protein